VCVVGLLGYVLSEREHRAEIHLEWAANPEARPSLQDTLMAMKPYEFSNLVGMDGSVVHGYVKGVEALEQCDEIEFHADLAFRVNLILR
jgi:hypothetical protein